MEIINKKTKIESGLTMTKRTYYIYTRTKNIVEEDSKTILFLFAGLTEKHTQYLGGSFRKRVVPIHSELIEVPLNEAPIYTEDIPIGTFTFELNAIEFERLHYIAKKQPKKFFLYKSGEVLRD